MQQMYNKQKPIKKITQKALQNKLQTDINAMEKYFFA